MTRATWIVYLVCAAIVFASWFGLVPGWISWIAWGVATLIALRSWVARDHRCSEPVVAQVKVKKAAPPPHDYTEEEMEAARREFSDDEEI